MTTSLVRRQGPIADTRNGRRGTKFGRKRGGSKKNRQYRNHHHQHHHHSDQHRPHHYQQQQQQQPRHAPEINGSNRVHEDVRNREQSSSSSSSLADEGPHRPLNHDADVDSARRSSNPVAVQADSRPGAHDRNADAMKDAPSSDEDGELDETAAPGTSSTSDQSGRGYVNRIGGAVGGDNSGDSQPRQGHQQPHGNDDPKQSHQNEFNGEGRGIGSARKRPRMPFRSQSAERRWSVDQASRDTSRMQSEETHNGSHSHNPTEKGDVYTQTHPDQQQRWERPHSQPNGRHARATNHHHHESFPTHQSEPHHKHFSRRRSSQPQHSSNSSSHNSDNWNNRNGRDAGSNRNSSFDGNQISHNKDLHDTSRQNNVHHHRAHRHHNQQQHHHQHHTSAPDSPSQHRRRLGTEAASFATTNTNTNTRPPFARDAPATTRRQSVTENNNSSSHQRNSNSDSRRDSDSHRDFQAERPNTEDNNHSNNHSNNDSKGAQRSEEDLNQNNMCRNYYVNPEAPRGGLPPKFTEDVPHDAGVPFVDRNPHGNTDKNFSDGSGEFQRYRRDGERDFHHQQQQQQQRQRNTANAGPHGNWNGGGNGGPYGRHHGGGNDGWRRERPPSNDRRPQGNQRGNFQRGMPQHLHRQRGPGNVNMGNNEKNHRPFHSPRNNGDIHNGNAQRFPRRTHHRPHQQQQQFQRQHRFRQPGPFDGRREGERDPNQPREPFPQRMQGGYQNDRNFNSPNSRGSMASPQDFRERRGYGRDGGDMMRDRTMNPSVNANNFDHGNAQMGSRIPRGQDPMMGNARRPSGPPRGYNIARSPRMSADRCNEPNLHRDRQEDAHYGDFHENVYPPFASNHPDGPRTSHGDDAMDGPDKGRDFEFQEMHNNHDRRPFDRQNDPHMNDQRRDMHDDEVAQPFDAEVVHASMHSSDRRGYYGDRQGEGHDHGRHQHEHEHRRHHDLDHQRSSSSNKPYHEVVPAFGVGTDPDSVSMTHQLSPENSFNPNADYTKNNDIARPMSQDEDHGRCSSPPRKRWRQDDGDLRSSHRNIPSSKSDHGSDQRQQKEGTERQTKLPPSTPPNAATQECAAAATNERDQSESTLLPVPSEWLKLKLKKTPVDRKAATSGSRPMAKISPKSTADKVDATANSGSASVSTKQSTSSTLASLSSAQFNNRAVTDSEGGSTASNLRDMVEHASRSLGTSTSTISRLPKQVKPRPADTRPNVSSSSNHRNSNADLTNDTSLPMKVPSAIVTKQKRTSDANQGNYDKHQAMSFLATSPDVATEDSLTACTTNEPTAPVVAHQVPSVIVRRDFDDNNVRCGRIEAATDSATSTPTRTSALATSNDADDSGDAAHQHIVRDEDSANGHAGKHAHLDDNDDNSVASNSSNASWPSSSSSSSDSDTDEEELMNWASKMFGITPPKIAHKKGTAPQTSPSSLSSSTSSSGQEDMEAVQRDMSHRRQHERPAQEPRQARDQQARDQEQPQPQRKIPTLHLRMSLKKLKRDSEASMQHKMPSIENVKDNNNIIREQPMPGAEAGADGATTSDEMRKQKMMRRKKKKKARMRAEREAREMAMRTSLPPSDRTKQQRSSPPVALPAPAHVSKKPGTTSSSMSKSMAAPPPTSQADVPRSAEVKKSKKKTKKDKMSNMTEAQLKKYQKDRAERKRIKESAKPLTSDQIKAILAEDDAGCCGGNWVRRSMRNPSRGHLDSPQMKAFVEKLRSNSPEMVVLKMKKYISDPNASVAVLDAALDALEENSNCEALYIQNFNLGMRDKQLMHLLKILQQPNCRIWCINVGELYNIRNKTWERFTRGLKRTQVTHMYASEHTITTEMKDDIRATIRDNRSKHDLHINPANLDVIVQCTHCWWNPINAKVLRPYIHNRGLQHILNDREAQGLRGSTSSAPSG